MISKQIAKHLRGVYFGGNWADNNLKTHLTAVTFAEAITPVFGLNTIATLAYHMTYYVREVAKVLGGEPLLAKDKLSFELPPMTCQADWEAFLTEIWAEAEQFATLIEQLPDEQLLKDFTDAKYGNYYGNLNGIIEHLHYHLGQVVVIRKILASEPDLIKK